ncbi:MAG: helix-turn-helix domain-containing protein [Bacteroides sp.]|nr:helix-turn-helix domain-containing protein [Bacteroides sp.]
MCYEPFLTDFALIFLRNKGEISCELNGRKFEARGAYLAIIPPHTLQKIIYESSDSEKKVLVLSKNVVDGIGMSRNERVFLNQAFLTNPIIPLSEKQYQNHLLYFNLIENELQDADNLNPTKTIQKIFEALITKYPISEAVQSIMSHPRDRKEALIQKFHLSLHDFCRQQRTVSFYAKKLSVTPQYLSKVTKEKSGKSAAELIEHYAIDRIKVSLFQESSSLKAIADDFHFGSLALMNKYFKRRTGISPAEYRKNGRIRPL